MKIVHEIPKGMVTPWMIWGCLAELFLGSFVAPAVVFIFFKWAPVMLAIPALLVASYLITAKDLFRFSVLYYINFNFPNSRSLKRWGGAKTYAPR